MIRRAPGERRDRRSLGNPLSGIRRGGCRARQKALIPFGGRGPRSAVRGATTICLGRIGRRGLCRLAESASRCAVTGATRTRLMERRVDAPRGACGEHVVRGSVLPALKGPRQGLRGGASRFAGRLGGVTSGRLGGGACSGRASAPLSMRPVPLRVSPRRSRMDMGWKQCSMWRIQGSTRSTRGAWIYW